MTEKVGLRAKCYGDLAGHALLASASILSNLGRELWKPRGQDKCIFSGLETLKKKFALRSVRREESVSGRSWVWGPTVPFQILTVLTETHEALTQQLQFGLNMQYKHTPHY